MGVTDSKESSNVPGSPTSPSLSSSSMPRWRRTRRKSDTVFFKPKKRAGVAEQNATEILAQTSNEEIREAIESSQRSLSSIQPSPIDETKAPLVSGESTMTSHEDQTVTSATSPATLIEDETMQNSISTTISDKPSPPPPSVPSSSPAPSPPSAPFVPSAPSAPSTPSSFSTPPAPTIPSSLSTPSAPSAVFDAKDQQQRQQTQIQEQPQKSALTKAEREMDDYIERVLRTSRFSPDQNSFVLNTSEITEICQKARAVFLSQPPLLRVGAPVKVVGDTHGQFRDLVRLFDLCGYPPNSNYLFLGDYVDRGKQSLETIILLFCYKIRYPDKIHILRGNHECANVNRVYGFFDECKRRCSVKVWKTFTDVFNCLPMASIIADKIFCVHGGLSPCLKKMNEIASIKRPTEIPEEGLLNDLLWSDPSETCEGWQDNDRGVSVIFGKKIVEEFLNRHNLDLVCRAHMVVEDGYEFFANRSLVTVFSAPNYCGEFNNCAAVMNVNTELICSFEILKPVSYRGRKLSNVK